MEKPPATRGYLWGALAEAVIGLAVFGRGCYGWAVTPPGEASTLAGDAIAVAIGVILLVLAADAAWRFLQHQRKR